MASIFQRVTRLTATRTLGTAAFIISAAGTAIACSLMPLNFSGVAGLAPPTTEANALTTPQSLTFKNSRAGLIFSGDISNPKLVQGELGTVYLSLSIESPLSGVTTSNRKPTDMLVVLDQSGSMSAENRLPYARAAIRDLISRLNAEDRFALVTFDSQATVRSPFVPVTDGEKSRIASLVETIHPGSGTNMSAGIEAARGLLLASNSDRSRRIILLSDGEANEGISSAEGLGALSAAVNRQGGVVSTIGMGLGFNERVMSLVADQGGGNFSYLESLASLGDILNKDLRDARQVFATASEIMLRLSHGITISDAGGYPIERLGDGNSYIVRAGQLLSGSGKKLFATINVPTAQVGNIKLGDIELRYTVDGRIESLPLNAEPLQLAILEPARRSEAVAAAKGDLLKDAWTKNNLGSLQQDIRDYVNRGDRAKASAAIASYMSQLSDAEKANGVALASPELKEEVSRMEAGINEAFSGSADQQKVKQNRLGKDLWTKGSSNKRNY